MQNRYAQFGWRKKIDEPGSSFSGWLKEKVTKDMSDTMDKVRDANVKIRKEVKSKIVDKFSEIIKLSKTPDSYICATAIGGYYLNTIDILNQFQEVIAEIEKEHQDLYDKLEEEHRSAIDSIHSKLEERGKLPAPKKVKAYTENGIIKLAWDWPWSKNKDSRMAGYEKMFPKRVKEFRKALDKELDDMRRLHAVAGNSFEKMNESIKDRNVGQWIEDVARYRVAFETFEIGFVKFYMSHLKPIKDWIDNRRAENEKKNQIPEEDKTQVFGRSEINEKLNQGEHEQVRDSEIISDANEPKIELSDEAAVGKKFVNPKLKSVSPEEFSRLVQKDPQNEIVQKFNKLYREKITKIENELKTEKDLVKRKQMLSKLQNEAFVELNEELSKSANNKLSALIKYAQLDNTPGMISEILKLSEKYESIDKAKSSKLLRIAEGLIYGR